MIDEVGKRARDASHLLRGSTGSARAAALIAMAEAVIE